MDNDEIEFIWSTYVSNYNKYHKDNPLFNEVNFIKVPNYSYLEVNNPSIMKMIWNDMISLSEPLMNINDNNLNQYLEQWVSYHMIKKQTDKIKFLGAPSWLLHNRDEKLR